jgi:hypothetical protein
MKIGRICESAPKPGTDLLKACPKQTHWADPNKVIEECARLKGHPFTDVCNLDFCLALTERLECNQADAENSSEIAAGLFHRSRELEERQRIESNSREAMCPMPGASEAMCRVPKTLMQMQRCLWF